MSKEIELEDITEQVVRKLLWQTLIDNKEFALLEKLNAVEKHDFETVIMPDNGFSEDNSTQNMTVDWLRMRGVNVWSPAVEAKELEDALHGVPHE